MSKILISAILSFTIASLIKVLFYYLATERWNFMVFFRTGGMPSSHTATVTSMSTSIYLLEGASNLFMVSLIVSSVIISDAVGIRRAAGKQAHILNKIVDEFKYYRKFKTKRLYELLGHTPKQVLAGFVLGVLITRIVFFF